MQTLPNNKSFPAALALLLPVLLWLGVIGYYSVNAPWYDDFDPFPDFLRHWMQEVSFSGRLKVLFQPNNEHRMVIGKLVTLLYFWVTGQLNFTYLHFAGAAFTLGTLVLVWRVFQKQHLPWWYFLPVVLLLFQFQHHLVFLWAICSLQHQPVVFFVCLSMFFLSKNKLAWALLAGLCATFAMSNGIFVWPAGAAILLLRSSWKSLALWLSVGVLAIGFYFHGMTSLGNEASIAYLRQYPHLSVLGFFAFLGGLFDFFPEQTIFFRSVLPVIMGFAAMCWVAIWLYQQIMPWLRSFAQKNKPDFADGSRREAMDFLLGIMAFLLANALIIGLLRPRFGFFVMIVSNYKMYPALFLVVAYLSFLFSYQNKKRTAFRIALAIATGIWCLTALYYLPVIAERSKYLTINAYNQQHHAFGLGHVPFSHGAVYVDRLMREMTDAGIYTYPEEGNVLAANARNAKSSGGDAAVQVSIGDASIHVDEPAGKRSISRGNARCAFLRRGDAVFLFKMNPHLYTGRNFLKQYDDGFDIDIPFSTLQKGSYELGIMHTEGGNTAAKILQAVTIP